MSNDYELLALSAPVGKGQENRPDDVAAFDNSLRRIGAYDPPPEYADEPQRYATEPVIDALDRFQDKNGLKVDGIANPGGPTERAINNRLLNKPRGVGLLFDPPPPIGNNVGNGMANESRDVASVKRRLGGLDYLPEDPFDSPSGIITDATTSGIKRFQLDNRLTPDGWMAPGGETEKALEKSNSDLARANGATWSAFAKRILLAETGDLSEAPKDSKSANDSADETAEDGIVPARVPPVPRPLPPWHPVQPPSRPFESRPGPRHRPDWRPVELPPESVRRRMDPRDILGRRNPFENLQPPSVGDIRRALDMPPETPLEEEARRELVIPRKTAEPPPQIHVPEPGSPLRIPILDIHHDGRRGNPKTVQSTVELVEAIKQECAKALKNTGARIESKYERYYQPRDGKLGDRLGSSYADGWVRFSIGKIVVDFVGDTYSPKMDAHPNKGEQDRYFKLQRNMSGEHGVVIRVPKAWTLGQEIDKQKLLDAVRVICDKIRNKLDKGELEPGRERLFMQELLASLVEAPANSPRRPMKRPGFRE